MILLTMILLDTTLPGICDLAIDSDKLF